MTIQNPNRFPAQATGYDRRSLDALQFINNNLYKIYQYPEPLARLASLIRQALSCSQVLIFSKDGQAELRYVSASPALESLPQEGDVPLTINTFNAQQPSLIGQLLAGSYAELAAQAHDTRLELLRQHLGTGPLGMMPLLIGTDLVGLIVGYNDDGAPLTKVQVDTLKVIALNIASTIQQTKRIDHLESQVNEMRQEMAILQQLDTELADTIELDYVFQMTMDWALRFTNADAAALSLYERDSDTVKLVAQYGHRPGAIQKNVPLQAPEAGISLRVARSGRAEIVPDVSQDKDFYPVADGIRTQLTVPIMREGSVIAVIALESRKLNGFTEEHQAFVRKLTQRAGVAVDNARLFTETRREREQLQHILKNIADIVIIVDSNNRISMMNYSAVLGLRLALDFNFLNQVFSEVIQHEPLLAHFREAVSSGEAVRDELELPDGRVYYIRIDHHVGIGHIIVMQDITHFKETERLKTELVATVSHDLKQPLSVMRGYLDLLKMTNSVSESGKRYVSNLELSFSTMRQLIDDLLEVAHIEAGLTLNADLLDLGEVLNNTLAQSKPNAEKKKQTLTLVVPDELPQVYGDAFRLHQIFVNLIGNAVKYTPLKGEITVRAEVHASSVRIYVEDTGMGIGPEDQTQVFNRFYRVRRPETDKIEGTGLGLAIVKSLVEAHKGKIDLQSELGVGSTFRVQLPLNPPT